jgi:hypothetical protein
MHVNITGSDRTQDVDDVTPLATGAVNDENPVRLRKNRKKLVDTSGIMSYHALRH